jgi:2-isopropylmalate synthase
MAAAYVEAEIGEGEDAHVLWGVGLNESIVTASLRAVVGALNREARRATAESGAAQPRP